VVDCLEPWMEPNAWVIFEWRACIRRWRAADAERLAGKLEWWPTEPAVERGRQL